MASHVERGQLKSATAKEWIVALGDKFAVDVAQRHQSFLQETLSALLGRPMALRLTQDTAVRKLATSEADAEVLDSEVAAEPAAVTAEDERVKKVLNVFKGKIRSSE